jgi:acetyl-CoA acetyltransferase
VAVPDLTPVVAGIGESEFSAKSALPFGHLQYDAIAAAIADAAVEPDDIEAVFTDSHVMPDLFPIDQVAATFQLRNIRNRGYFGLGGVGIGLAVINAAQAVQSGSVKAALVYFGVNWGSGPAPYAFHERYPSKRALEFPFGFYGQPTYYALRARRYAHNYGLSEDKLSAALGNVAVEQRRNALKNPKAQMRKELSLADHQAGSMISDPLRRHDCCLISDGAGALVVTSRSFALERAEPRRAVTIAGGGCATVPYTEDAYVTQNDIYPALAAAKQSSQRAFACSGYSPSDLDFAEIYDCFTISVLLQLEQLGVCAPGEAHDFHGDPSRSLAINTHGGFLSQAYLLGINHFTEAVRQLRGEAGEGQVPGARLGAISLAPGTDHSTVLLAAA